jgi:3-oxo-5-alpha-steroid 4-dehydrogenase 1
VHALAPYDWLLVAEYLAAPATLVSLLFVTAPYGRHERKGFGPTLPARVGWLVMESPAVLFFAFVYARGAHRAEAAPLALLALWQIHYVHRTFVFPRLISGTGRRMPVMIALLAVGFNLLNGYLNAAWISEIGSYSQGYLLGWRFIAGSLCFAFGFTVNVVSDRQLLRLRSRAGEYQVPQGLLFKWVSCPNYLGEMIEWFGFALAAWSPAGLAFALYTVANLAPRALAHQAWYRNRFPNYPRDRRALIPFVL